MTYRLLALDLDGTLLRSDHGIDPRDLAAIRELRAAGVTVTIVTGRMRAGSLAAAHACEIAGAIACVEGSHLAEVASGRTLAHHALGGAAVLGLRDAFRAAGLASFVFDADVIHHDASGEPFAGYVSVWSPNRRVVEEALDEAVWGSGPLAAIAIGGPDQVGAALAAAHAVGVFAVRFEVRAFPGRHAVLVRAAGPTKGTALAELCRLAGCAPTEAVAVGDWINDVPMFAVAGRSFAMGGAPDAVRAAASDSLDTVAGAGGGIAEAIRRAWG
jgi:hydroxymethylpyrimidine pyrophosphatase-like HAD family hydrolase